MQEQTLSNLAQLPEAAESALQDLAVVREQLIGAILSKVYSLEGSVRESFMRRRNKLVAADEALKSASSFCNDVLQAAAMMSDVDVVLGGPRFKAKLEAARVLVSSCSGDDGADATGGRSPQEALRLRVDVSPILAAIASLGDGSAL